MNQTDVIAMIPLGPRNGEPKTDRLADLQRLLRLFRYSPDDLRFFVAEIETQKALIEAQRKARRR